jgi:hypothetical protein
MCLTIVEILFFISGLWLLVSGKIPSKLFQILFGKGNYQLSPSNARLFGLLLISPLPLVYGVSFILALFTTQNQLGLAMGFEFVYDLVVIIIAIIIARKCRKTPQQIDSTANQSN